MKKTKIYFLNIDTDRYTVSEMIDISAEPKILAGYSEHYGSVINMELDFMTYDDLHFQNNVDLLYRFPNISLSRDKLTIYSEKSNFKVTRNKDLADIAVVSTKFFDKAIERSWSIPLSKSTMIRFFDDIITYDKSDKILNLYNSILNEDDDTMYLYSSYYVSTDNTKFKKSCDIISDQKARLARKYVCYYKHYDEYNWLVKNSNKLMMDTEVNKLCTADSVTLYKDDFERLEELLKSSDKDNVNVGLTLMANCNVNESKTFLSLLFAFYSENMKSTKVWNQVNFKYLRKVFEEYINIQPGNWGHAYDMLIKKLVKDDILTLYASRYVANKMFIGVLQNNFGVGNKDGVFKISEESLQLRPEIAEKLVNEPEEKLSEILLNDYAVQGSMNHGGDLPF